MRSKTPSFSLAFSLSLLAGCALVAGLGDFEPANGGGGSGGEDGKGGSAVEGGAGGEPSAAGGPEGGGDACAADLVISEVRTRGAGEGDDDFVEIHNPTSQAMSLDDVAIVGRTPGGPTLTERWRGTSVDAIPAKGFVVIGGRGFMDRAKDYPLEVSLGDEIILLLQRGPIGTGTIDVVCVCLTACTSADWDGCEGVLTNAALVEGEVMDIDDSLQRVPTCRDTNTASDFEVHPATPGEENGP